jgi:hypothetical protein
MSTNGTNGTSTSGRRWWIVAAVVGALGAVALAGLVVAAIYSMSIPPPSFPSLRDRPDPTLHGTVAYFSDGCVRVVSASGARERELLCLDDDEENGPQLDWRPNGRLVVTTFTWPTGGELGPGAQWIVDVANGAIEDVPAVRLPERPDRTPEPAVGPDGERVTTTRTVSAWPIERSTLTVRIEQSGRRRILMSGTGNRDYGVALGGAPVFSPDGAWIVLNDGRLLLITTGADSEARILEDHPTGVGSWGSALIRTFAVTDADLLDVPRG